MVVAAPADVKDNHHLLNDLPSTLQCPEFVELAVFSNFPVVNVQHM